MKGKMAYGKVKKTHQSKGKDYKVPRSATFKAKGNSNQHATHGGGSKRHK